MNDTDAKNTILAQCEAWAALGINTVECSYSGSGDEGNIDEFSFNDSEDYKENSEFEKKAGLADGWETPLFDAFESLTFANVSGNDEGGGGTITVDVKEKTITRAEYFNVGSQEYLNPEVI